MEVEKTILNLIPCLLTKIDKNKEGVAIDIGLGTSNFHCLVFARNGYKTFAIEPLPVSVLFELASKYNFELFQGCIHLHDQEINIYSGIFNGENVMDVSSNNKNWWGVKETSKVISVPSLTFKSFTNKYNINLISYLKIDTEGSEWEIIQQLKKGEDYTLPEVIEFEYGGGDLKMSKKAGWSDEYFKKTLHCISHLYDLGYHFLIVFEKREHRIIKYDVRNINDIPRIFKDFYEYGNIIMSKNQLMSIYLLQLNILSSLAYLFLRSLKQNLKRVMRKFVRLSIKCT